MVIKATCRDCAKFGITCNDMLGMEPAGTCYVSRCQYMTDEGECRLENKTCHRINDWPKEKD